MSRRRIRIAGIEADERTTGMTAAALECRDIGHAWHRVPMGPSRRAALANIGQVEKIQVCGRCTAQKTQIIDVIERIRVGSVKITYGEGYLISREFAGMGKLSRMDAFVAAIARDEL